MILARMAKPASIGSHVIPYNLAKSVMAYIWKRLFEIR